MASGERIVRTLRWEGIGVGKRGLERYSERNGSIGYVDDRRTWKETCRDMRRESKGPWDRDV